MSHPVFTAPWADAWREAINASDRYREAAADWEVPLALVAVDGDAPPRGVYLDLFRGRCREARPVEPADLDATPFVLAAGYPVWRRVLRGDLEPLFGLLSGKIELRRGDLATLSTRVAAAKALVATAAGVDTVFPDGERDGA